MVGGREGSSVLVSVLPSNAEPNTILKQTSNLLLNLKLTLFNCSFIDLSMRWPESDQLVLGLWSWLFSGHLPLL